MFSPGVPTGFSMYEGGDGGRGSVCGGTGTGKSGSPTCNGQRYKVIESPLWAANDLSTE